MLRKLRLQQPLLVLLALQLLLQLLCTNLLLHASHLHLPTPVTYTTYTPCYTSYWVAGNLPLETMFRTTFDLKPKPSHPRMR